ncbi:MAG: hypothetical protein ABJA78_03790 [Ferruginibacter sp.]
MKRISVIPILFLCVILINSCSKSNTAPQTFVCNGSLTFSENIKRILDVNCNACHAPNSGYSQALSKWTYDGSYQSVFGRRNDINGLVAAGIMPQSGALSQAVRDSIACWVNNGAGN